MRLLYRFSTCTICSKVERDQLNWFRVMRRTSKLSRRFESAFAHRADDLNGLRLKPQMPSDETKSRFRSSTNSENKDAESKINFSSCDDCLDGVPPPTMQESLYSCSVPLNARDKLARRRAMSRLCVSGESKHLCNNDEPAFGRPI